MERAGRNISIAAGLLFRWGWLHRRWPCPRGPEHDIQARLAVQGRPHAHLGTQQEGINGLRGVVVFVEFDAPPPLRGASGSTRGASEDQDHDPRNKAEP